MSNKIQVRLEDGTIEVPDKFLVYGVEYNTQLQAEEAIKKETYKQLDRWLEENTFLLSGDRDTLLTEISKLDYSTLHTFISLLKDLSELRIN